MIVHIRIQICSCKLPVLVYIICPAHRLQSLTTQHMTTMFNHSWACSTLCNAIEWQLIWVVSNRWTGLWTGLLDWTAGLDYRTDLWTKIVCTTSPPPNQMCCEWVTCSMLITEQLIDCRETNNAACSYCGRFVHILQQIEQLGLGRAIGTIIYPKASCWPSIVFTWLLWLNKTMGIA